MSYELEVSGEHHFFTSSAAFWRVNSSLYSCLRDQRRADKSLKNFKIKGCNVYKVPGPTTQHYDIDNFQPQVEGTEWVHYEEY